MPAAWRAVVLLLGAACAGGSGPAPRPAPAPGPAQRPTMDPGRTDAPAEVAVRYPVAGAGVTRYVLNRRDSIAVTMPSGESQLQMSGSTAWASLRWSATDSGTHFAATVDSLQSDQDLPIPFEQVDSVQQARWTFFRTPTGRIVHLTGGPASLRGDQIRDQLVLLFPPLPAGGARPGAVWADSAAFPTRVSAFEATEQAAVEVRAAAVPGPRGSLGVTLDRRRTAEGAGTQFGQAITVRATGTDTLEVVLGLDGAVQSAAGTRVTSLVVELPAIGQAVPVHQVSFLRATVLP